MYLTWASFNNLRMFLMACMPIVIFYLIWLVNTSEGIRNEEGTLLDLVCSPDGNAIPVLITCASIIAVVIELYGLYQLFKAGLPRHDYDVTNGLFYYIWALITIIVIFLAIMVYSTTQSTTIRAKIKDGIAQAMNQYSTHLPSKVAIDRLQTLFHCCGRLNYKEWFYIPWISKGETTKSKIGAATKIFYADNVPYSCCSMDAMFPCVHHGIEHKGTIYKYDPSSTPLTIWTEGCEEKVIKEMLSVSWRFNAVMALIVIAMVLQIVAVRYLHTAYKSGLHVANQIACRAYLLRSVTDTEGMADDKGFTHRMEARSFYRASRRTRGKTLNATSLSDVDSSDELLPTIE